MEIPVQTMDTTNSGNLGCPCFADYPQIGADEYGFCISANELNTSFSSFVDAIILAIPKASLASGATSPSVFRFTIPVFAVESFVRSSQANSDLWEFRVCSGCGPFLPDTHRTG